MRRSLLLETLEPAGHAAAARLVAPHLRAEDVDECRRLYRHEPEEALLAALGESQWACLASCDDQPAAVFGITDRSIVPRIGVPWMLSARGLDLVPPRMVLELTRHYVRLWSERYDLLVNHVDARYRRAHRWLRAAGFTLGPEERVKGIHDRVRRLSLEGVSHV